MKVQEIREKNRGEIEKALAEARESARKMAFEISSQQTKNHAAYRKLKKEIARMLTVLAEQSRVKSE